MVSDNLKAISPKASLTGFSNSGFRAFKPGKVVFSCGAFPALHRMGTGIWSFTLYHQSLSSLNWDKQTTSSDFVNVP